jgi:hypothetical protein
VNTPLVLDDPDFLKQFARASMLHTHLDDPLKMFVRSFDGTTIEEALEYIGYQGATRLRDHVTRLATEQLGDCEALSAYWAARTILSPITANGPRRAVPPPDHAPREITAPCGRSLKRFG